MSHTGFPGISKINMTVWGFFFLCLITPSFIFRRKKTVLFPPVQRWQSCFLTEILTDVFSPSDNVSLIIHIYLISHLAITLIRSGIYRHWGVTVRRDAFEHNINFISKREVRNVLMENINSLLQKDNPDLMSSQGDCQLLFWLSKAFF